MGISDRCAGDVMPLVQGHTLRITEFEDRFDMLQNVISSCVLQPRTQEDITDSELWGKQQNDRQVFGKQDSFSPDSMKALEHGVRAISLEKSKEIERLDGKEQPSHWDP